MAILTINGTITEDESAGLQTSGVPTSTEDNNDNDVASLSSALATQLSAAITADGVTVPAPVTGFFPSFAQVNGFVSVNLAGATLSNIFFSDGGGAKLNNFDSGLNTTGGSDILLTTSASDDNVVYGKDSTGALVFAIVLHETQTGGVTTGGDIGIAQYQAIANDSAANTPDDPVDLLNHLFLSAATETVISDFSFAPPGQQLWIGVPSGGGNAGILVTGINPNSGQPTAGDRVNVSTTGLGENSQAVDHLEGLRIDFVNNVFVPNQTQADDPNQLTYSTHHTSAGAGWSPVQVNPGGSNIRVDAAMAAFDATGDNKQQAFFTDITSPNPAQSQAIIGSVEVFNSSGVSFGKATRPPGGSGNAVPLTGGDPNTTDPALNVDFLAGGTATVHGLLDDYRVEFRTDTPMDRFTITNVTSQPNRSFDVSRIVILEAASETDEVGSKVIFEDDGPSITATATGAPTLTVDETVLATNATASFAAQFTASFGADGAAAATPVSYALSTPGGASGLTDTASNNPVFLFLESGQVVGRAGTDAIAAASGPIVFVVSADGSGNVTLDQQRSIVHPDATNPDDSKSLTGSNLVSLTSTVKDGDGDTNSATLDITSLLVFKDDGPTITATLTNAPKPTVDETNLATNDTEAFAGQFTKSFGADGPAASGSDTYALGTAGGNSGLTDTASKNPVFLFLESGQVVGREGTDATAAASGPIVFIVSVDGSGNVTLDQQRAIVHADTTNPDDARSMTTANLVTLTETVKDGDGDTKSATLDITSLLVFKDDGPSIAPVDTALLDFSAGSSSTKSLGEAAGADGFGSHQITSFPAPSTLADGLSTLKTSINGAQTDLIYYQDGNNNNTVDPGEAFFELKLNGDNTYTFSVLHDPPPITVPLNFGAIQSGSPQETLSPPAGSTGDVVTFDGLIFNSSTPTPFTSSTTEAFLSQYNLGASSTDDDLNPDSLGFGEKQGQASQMNPNEGWFAVTKDGSGNLVPMLGLSFQIQGVGSVPSVQIDWITFDRDSSGNSTFDAAGESTVTIPSGNNTVPFSISPAGLGPAGFEVAYLRYTFPGQGTNVGIRNINFSTTLAGSFPDQKLPFEVTATDGDGDFAKGTFNVSLDGNHDGKVTLA